MDAVTEPRSSDVKGAPGTEPAERARPFWRIVRSSHATMGLAISWFVVYLAMAYQQGSIHAGKDVLAGGIVTTTSNSYGHLTAAQFFAGEIWRPLTATFVHYSLAHLFMNLIGLVLLGALVEMWYGWGQWLGLYVVLGYGGNVLACLAKLYGPGRLPSWLLAPDYPSGGGSTVICGLVGLLAVAGWRDRRKLGHLLWAQMVLAIGLTAALGVWVPNVDNLGHAGGTLVGLCLGFADLAMVRQHDKGRGLAWGILGLLAIGMAGAAQAGFDLADSRNPLQAVKLQQLQRELARDTLVLAVLEQVAAIYEQLIRRGPSGLGHLESPDIRALKPRTMNLVVARASPMVLSARLATLLEQLGTIDQGLRTGPVAATYLRFLDLARVATGRPPSLNEFQQFRLQLGPIVLSARQSIQRRALLLQSLRAAQERLTTSH